MTYLILFGYLSAYSFLTIAVMILSAILFGTTFRDPINVLVAFFLLSMIVWMVMVVLTYAFGLPFKTMVLIPVPIYVGMGLWAILSKGQ